MEFLDGSRPSGPITLSCTKRRARRRWAPTAASWRGDVFPTPAAIATSLLCGCFASDFGGLGRGGDGSAERRQPLHGVYIWLLRCARAAAPATLPEVEDEQRPRIQRRWLLPPVLTLACPLRAAGRLEVKHGGPCGSISINQGQWHSARAWHCLREVVGEGIASA